MNNLQLFQTIEENQKNISSFGKFEDDVLKKINYKLRLDWNYYSNRMEGGTLTREETRSVMIGNIDVKDKPLKDIMEMNGHNKVVLDIQKIGKGELRISESRIKEIHKAIMYEESDSEKVMEIGKWKSKPNEIINYQGEKYSFTAPDAVAETLHKLLDNTNSELDTYFRGKSKKHAIEIATQFHISFLTIHPFYDGNGRTARILTNLLLISCGYPVIIIKDELKQAYYRLLADIQVNGGSADLLVSFLAERLIESQGLILTALSGKDIEEADDLDKKLALLVLDLKNADANNEIKVQLNADYFEEALNTWVSDLLTKTIPKIQKFNHFFATSHHTVEIQNTSKNTIFSNETPFEIIEKMILNFKSSKNNFQKNITTIMFYTFYETFLKGGLYAFDSRYGFEIKFDMNKYEVHVDEFSAGNYQRVLLFQHLLHNPLNEDEINEIVSKLSNTIFEHIDFNTKRIGLR